jgi:hypothetical protein
METKKCEYCGSDMGTYCGWFVRPIEEGDGSTIGWTEVFGEGVHCFNDSCSSNDLPF